LRLPHQRGNGLCPANKASDARRLGEPRLWTGQNQVWPHDHVSRGRGAKLAFRVGAFSRRTRLTAQQTAFVREYVRNGGNGAAAARAAGYSEVSAAKYAYQLLELPHVQAGIRAEREREIGSLATVSLGVVRGILEDKGNATLGDKKLRLDAAKVALAAAGHVAPKAPDAPEAGEKNYEAMSTAELEEFVRTVKERIASERSAAQAADSAHSTAKEPELEPA
jgi:phage terminase small subunit